MEDRDRIGRGFLVDTGKTRLSSERTTIFSMTEISGLWLRQVAFAHVVVLIDTNLSTPPRRGSPARRLRQRRAPGTAERHPGQAEGRAGGYGRSKAKPTRVRPEARPPLAGHRY